MKSIKWFVISIIGVYVLFSSLTSQQLVFAKNHQVSSSPTQLKEQVTTRENLNPELSHQDIVALTNTFMDTLVQETDHNYKVIQFGSNDELINELEKVTTREIAKGFVDYYYTETTEGMYILPTETPPWFLEENDYDMIKVNESTVKVIQDNYTELDGKYRLELEFTYKTDWKITNIHYE